MCVSTRKRDTPPYKLASIWVEITTRPKEEPGANGFIEPHKVCIGFYRRGKGRHYSLSNWPFGDGCRRIKSSLSPRNLVDWKRISNTQKRLCRKYRIICSENGCLSDSGSFTAQHCRKAPTLMLRLAFEMWPRSFASIGCLQPTVSLETPGHHIL